jgi:uncharacterized SAM-binding protein YcdF (DUF218 family)
METSISAERDAIVVLGCPVLEGGQLGRTAERRVWRAADAFRASPVPLVIVSGGRRWHGGAEADVLGDHLEQLGVPAGVIVRELCSLSTVENAAYSIEILRERGLLRPAIVTCDWHMARALACFAWIGLAATPLAAHSERRARTATMARTTLERVRSVLDRRAARQWIER